MECFHPPPQAGTLFSLLPRNCHSAGGLLETPVPRYAAPTCGGSDPQTPFTARIRQAPSSRYRLEIATEPAGSTTPGAQPSARRLPTAHGGSVIMGPRGARRPPAGTHALWPGMGKSGGRPITLASPARSRLLTPSHIASTPPQSGAHGHITA